MGSEEGKGVVCTDATTSWQQYYTWCSPYSHSHPHHQQHQHLNHPYQYQQQQQQQQQQVTSGGINGSGSGQYKQHPPSASTMNVTSTLYPASQHHQMQLQPAQQPPPPPTSLHQQHQFHLLPGQCTTRKAVPYDGSVSYLLIDQIEKLQLKNMKNIV
ncbi:putative serine/threonine-protein kinase yakA [Vespula squamosa]|uniref:Serine/threonine-protein kinase yakA n=1 Tax=Vespula squamosa TaxID=30214 RepID=A0ABD2B812_VESSQ